MILSRKLATVMAAVLSSALLKNTSCVEADSNTSSSIFDIPSKSPQELKAIVDDLPNLRAGKRHMQEVSMEELGFGVGPRASIPVTPEERAQERINKAKRMQDRRTRAKELIQKHQPEPGRMERLGNQDIQKIYRNAIQADPSLTKENHSWLRDLGGDYTSSEVPYFLSPTNEYYDPWAQGYRMLGGFIDCDQQGGSGSHSGSGDNHRKLNDGGDGACSRWMMWAAYVNPNYSGGGRDEYFNYNYNQYDEYGDGDGDGSSTNNGLDCHSPNTSWELIGVYRQEFYQYIEQISKHLWAIDDYEYVVALAGLAYMTDDDCKKVGYDSQGQYLYAGIMPYTGGMYSIGLYTDAQCLYPDTNSGMTYDDFGQTNDMNLGSKDDGSLSDDELATLYGYWTATQEYTLELLNEVYSEFKYCTLCMDYPTYQDGYFIGDSGTDDDDIINQCWKFHSHDSYTCETSCLAMGDAQGSILQINYAGRSFGTSWDGSSGEGNSRVYDHYSKGYTGGGGSNFEKFKANAYLTFNGVLFIATFLAFSVARGSRSNSDKSRSLLSREERKKARSSGSRRSKSASGRSTSGRSKSRSGRKSGDRTSRSGSASRKRSSSRK